MAPAQECGGAAAERGQRPFRRADRAGRVLAVPCEGNGLRAGNEVGEAEESRAVRIGASLTTRQRAAPAQLGHGLPASREPSLTC